MFEDFDFSVVIRRAKNGWVVSASDSGFAFTKAYVFQTRKALDEFFDRTIYSPKPPSDLDLG